MALQPLTKNLPTALTAGVATVSEGFHRPDHLYLTFLIKGFAQNTDCGSWKYTVRAPPYTPDNLSAETAS